MSPARSTRCWLTTARQFTDLRTTRPPGVPTGKRPPPPAVSLSVRLKLKLEA